MWMSAEEVVESSLRALKQGKVIHIPGWQNRILAALIYLAPIGLQQWVFSRQIRAGHN
jgi:short-subunit dehydrogenase